MKHTTHKQLLLALWSFTILLGYALPDLLTWADIHSYSSYMLVAGLFSVLLCAMVAYSLIVFCLMLDSKED